jgi:hypothetical protein
MSDRNTQKYDNTLILLYQFPNLTPSSLIETIICAAIAPLHQSKAKQSNPYNLSQHLHPTSKSPKAVSPSPKRKTKAKQPQPHLPRYHSMKRSLQPVVSPWA